MNLIFSVFIENLECANTGANEYQYTDENKIVKFGGFRDLLEQKQQEYASSIGVDYKLYTDFGDFTEKYDLSFLSKYDVINFYKIYLFYKNQGYENILYLDFDVVPNTSENFFEVHDLSKGVHVKTSGRPTENIWAKGLKKSIRSPFAKYYNTHAMLIDEFGSGDNNVFNTGILAMNQSTLSELDYFGDFEGKLQLMTDVKENGWDMYPESVYKLFNYDNETLFSYLIEKTGVSWVELSDLWHYTYDKQESISPDAKLIHFINKRFEDFLK